MPAVTGKRPFLCRSRPCLAKQERASGRHGQRKGVRSSDASRSAQSLSPLSWLHDHVTGLVRLVQFLPLLWLRLRSRCHGRRRASGRGRGTSPPAPTPAISRQAATVNPNLPIGQARHADKEGSQTVAALLLSYPRLKPSLAGQPRPEGLASTKARQYT